jgi:hypothetical protein
LLDELRAAGAPDTALGLYRRSDLE